MSDEPTPNHDETVELLPDYAVGALDEESLPLVEAHLEGCAACQRELDGLLEVLGLLTVVAPPRPEVRGSLVDRVQAEIAAPPADLAAPPEVPAALPTEPVVPAALEPAPSDPPLAAPVERPPAPGTPPRPPIRLWQQVPARLALAAVLLAALLSLAVWNVVLQNRLDDENTIAALIADPNAPHTLADSELQTGAGGVVYTDPARRQAFLVAHDLPPLPSDQRYQIWLFTDDGDRASGGLLDIDPNGYGQTLLEAPEPLANYSALALSAEPAAGSDAPTSPLALGSWLD